MTRGPAGRAAVQAVCLAAGLGGVVALVAAAVYGRGHAPWQLVVGLACAVVLMELLPLHLTHEGQSEALRLEEAFLVPMILLLAPVETLGILAAALAVASATSARRNLMKGIFNVGMVTACSGLGILTAWTLGVEGDVGTRDLFAAAAGALVYCATSALAVSGVISLAQGGRYREVLLDGIVVRIATWGGSISLGVLVSITAVDRPTALLVAAVPVVVLHLAFSGALRQWRHRHQAESLYQAAARVRDAAGSVEVRRELVEAARGLLAVEHAAVVDVSAEDHEGLLRVPLGELEALEVSGRASGGTWTSEDVALLRALAGVGEAALAAARHVENLRAVTRSLGEGVLVLDEDGRITTANPAAEQLLGWGRGELLGHHVAASVDVEGLERAVDGTAAWVHLPRLQAGETLRIEEHVLHRRDEAPLEVALTASPVVRDGVVVGAVVVFRDMSERRALERRLVHQAFHDPLTGLPHRALFLDRLEHATQRSERDGTSIAVLFIDVDRFKVINDSLGHRVGDDVLQTIASRIVGMMRAGDTVARFGGDEFTVLLEDGIDVHDARASAARILEVLQRPIVAGDREVVVSVSIGIAVSEPGQMTDLLVAADMAMYRAKAEGKNRAAVASGEHDVHALARLDLEMELRRALEQDELEVHYQPVVDAQSGRLHGLEALVRWRHPRLGLLGPGHFMDVAEESGLVLTLGEQVLDQACRAAVEWAQRHPELPVVMAVNLSARQFSQPDLCDRVAAVLQRTGLAPGGLALEITETVVMADTDTTLRTLQALKALDVRLSVDDFGTGYSSLSYLKKFPFDVVKIDRSFVEGLGSSPVDHEIVQAVIRLASALGMSTVAEGVETTAQRDQLRLLGCTSLQGFLLARPAPVADIERLLRRELPSPRTSEDAGVRPGSRVGR